MNVRYKQVHGKPDPMPPDCPTEGASRDIRQEHLDQLMKTFEKSFPGFYEAILDISRQNKHGPGRP